MNVYLFFQLTTELIKMSIPNLQNIQNKLFPIINKEMPRYMGQTNFVSKYIPEIFVGVSQGAIGGDLDKELLEAI